MTLRRPSRTFLSTVAVLSLALAACGGTDVGADGGIGDGAGPPNLTFPGDPGAPIPIEGEGGIGDGTRGEQFPDQSTAMPREATGNTIDPRPREWSEITFNQTQDSLTVYAFAGVEPCDVVDRVDVEYTDEAVTVTLFMGPTDRDTACIEIAQWISVTVDMTETLGPRSVLDGAKA